MEEGSENRGGEGLLSPRPASGGKNADLPELQQGLEI